jgi:Fur family ferric uptake transcriptional regulator
MATRALLSLIQSKGLKLTDQRKLIAEVLEASDDHPDVEELYRRASAKDPRISIATVYRTLRLFEEYNVVQRHDFKDGRARYEGGAIGQHGHLIDIRTRDIIEFDDPEILVLLETIAARQGYRMMDYRLEIYGIPAPEGEEVP